MLLSRFALGAGLTTGIGTVRFCVIVAAMPLGAIATPTRFAVW